MIKINIVGDISLNNRYQELAHQHKEPFNAVKDIFSTADFNMGNLECLCDTVGNINLLKKPRLTTTPEALDLLLPLRFHALNLAHNHIYDACETGIYCTCDKIHDMNANYIGYSTNKDSSFIKFFPVKGRNVAVISAVHRDTNPHIPETAGIAPPYYDANETIRYIHAAKDKKSFVIVYPHWGGRVEEGFIPDWYEINDARLFIDAGADIVIGGHSHTVQPYEKYKGKYIFYSLGNFCFDDICNNGIIYPIGRYRKRRGIIVTLNVEEKDNHSYTVKVTPIKNNNNFIIPYPIYRISIYRRNIMFLFLKKFHKLWKINYKLFRKISPLWIYAVENTDPWKVKLSKLSLDRIIKQFKHK